MSPANITKHEPACAELHKYKHLFAEEITTRQFKQFRMRLRTVYGMTVEEYHLLHDAQDGKCHICKGDPNDNKQHLSVDHCHTTGDIRGLLCSRCNFIIGNAKDNVEILNQAVRYLMREDWHS